MCVTSSCYFLVPTEHSLGKAIVVVINVAYVSSGRHNLHSFLFRGTKKVLNLLWLKLH